MSHMSELDAEMHNLNEHGANVFTVKHFSPTDIVVDNSFYEPILVSHSEEATMAFIEKVIKVYIDNPIILHDFDARRELLPEATNE